MHIIHAQNHEGVRVKVLVSDGLHNRIVEDLHLQKLSILSVKKASWFKSLFFRLRQSYVKRSKINLSQQRFFSTEIGTMLKAGIPIHEAMIQILLHSFNFKLSYAIYSAYQQLLKGASIQEAFQGYPKIFTPTFLGFLQQAQHTGKLAQSFVQFSEYCEYKIRNARSVGANLLPLIFSMGLAWVLTYFIHKNILYVFIEEAKLMGDSLPTPTAIFETLRPWVLSYKVVVVIFTTQFLFSKMMNSAWIVRVPFLNKRVNLMAKLQFLKATTISLKTGLNVQDAFGVAQSVLENPYYKRTVGNALKLLEHGIERAFVLKEMKLFASLQRSLLSNSHTREGLIENMEVITEFIESELAIWDSLTSLAKKYIVLIFIVLYLLLTALAVMYPMMGWNA